MEHPLLVAGGVCLFYFFVLFLLSSYEEMVRIQELTAYYNFCSEDEFERKVAEILIELGLVKDYNYYVVKNEDIYAIAHSCYGKNFAFRNLCYRTGVKSRLEKKFYVMNVDH